MKKHVYEYDEVVVGNNLAALFYCYKNLCPLLHKEGAPLFSFDFFEKDFPLEDIYLTNSLHELKTPTGSTYVGRKKLEIYSELLFILSAAGLVPFSDKIEKMRLEEKQLKVITKRGRSSMVKFNKIRVFSPDTLDGIGLIKVKKQKLRVLDIFRIISKKHNFNLIKTEDNFVNEIQFVNSKKRKDIKNIMVFSSLSKKEVDSFNFSVVPLKYKLRDVLEQNGIEKRKYDSNIILDFIDRKTYNQDIKYYDDKSIIIDTRTEREICQGRKQSMCSNLLGAYPWRLHHLLMDSNGMIR